MSAETVTVEPIPGREAEGVVLEEISRASNPRPILRVDVDGTTWRVPEEECR